MGSQTASSLRLSYRKLDHDLRLFVETVPENLLTGENEPGSALWRDDTARFSGLRVVQLSVAGSMLRRGHDRLMSRFAEISALSDQQPESPIQKTPDRARRILSISETDRNRKSREYLTNLLVQGASTVRMPPLTYEFLSGFTEGRGGF